MRFVSTLFHVESYTFIHVIVAGKAQRKKELKKAPFPPVPRGYAA